MDPSVAASGEPLFPTLRDESQSRHVALQPGRYIWRQRHALRDVYCSRRFAALRSVGWNYECPTPSQVAFIRLASRVRLPTRHSRFRISRLAASSAVMGMRDHSAVAPFPA